MKFPTWLEMESGRLAALHGRHQLPHALLIHGPVGVGRRLLAFRLVDDLLESKVELPDLTRLSANRLDDDALPAHPDFRLLQPLEDKQTISIDQVRELIGFLSLTSHQGGAKVAMVAPAQSMTPSAANCLLKTLEEPTANSYLILVAEALPRLPSTIVSRCHRIRVSLPERQAADDWLCSLEPAVDWHRPLELSAGAPLTALALHQNGFPQLADELQQDLSALRRRTATPASVAKRWAKIDGDACLRWLFNTLSEEIRTQITNWKVEPVVNSQNHRLQKSTETLNMEPSFVVLRQIGELRRLQGTGLNAELHLTDVLARWYG